MRITDNMRFNTTLRNLFSTQSQYNYLMEKIASQKKVNRASDDPVAATRIINIRQSKAAIEQYMKNIDSSNTWISSTEATLSGASKLLDSANKIAIGAMGADEATREIAAANIQAIIDSMFSLANTKWGDSYLFSGSQTSTQPFSAVENPPTIGDAVKAGGNVYAGNVSSGAAFAGVADKTYQVEIVDGGDLSAATYHISSDGGTTWGTEKEDLDTGTIYLGDGIKLTFTPGTFDAGDTFSVAAHAATGIIDAPVAVGVNGYDTGGGVVSSGSYFTGDVNKTYAVKITTAGAPGTAKYQISTDGGRNWEIETLSDVSGVVNLGDGVRMTFSAAAFGENDIFYVNATAAGYYQGDDENLSMTITRGTNFAYNVSGAEAFTEAGGVDVFKTLTALKEALDDNNDSEIYAQRSNIELAGGQILLCQSRCGMKASHLEVVKNNLVQFDETLNFLHSEAQAADITELGVKLLMSETALKTTYAMAARIGEATILNYLK
jgi:flagellar hook-associated protein 3 FlgL